MADGGTPSPSASAETVVPPARSVESEHEHQQGSPQHESNNSQDEIEDEEASSDGRDTQPPTQPTLGIGGEQIFF